MLNHPGAQTLMPDVRAMPTKGEALRAAFPGE